MSPTVLLACFWRENFWMSTDLPRTLIASVLEIAQSAAKAILEFHQMAGKKEFKLKNDQSPVTQADFAANRIIINGLSVISTLPIISEEEVLAPWSQRQHWQRYWLVDPLDGTKEFIANSENFTVNIALIENHQPILGVIVLPVSKTCYTASKGGSAEKITADGTTSALKIALWQNDRELRVAAGRRHNDQDIDRLALGNTPVDLTRKGSSVKFCDVAEGLVDVYPRFGPTSEWDSAAGQCIVEQAGGKVVTLEGEALRYNTKASLLNPDFIVLGDFESIENQFGGEKWQ